MAVEVIDLAEQCEKEREEENKGAERIQRFVEAVARETGLEGRFDFHSHSPSDNVNFPSIQGHWSLVNVKKQKILFFNSEKKEEERVARFFRTSWYDGNFAGIWTGLVSLPLLEIEFSPKHRYYLDGFVRAVEKNAIKLLEGTNVKIAICKKCI